MDDHLAGEHGVLEVHQRKDVHMLQAQCIGDLGSIAKAGMQDQLLLEASFCGISCAMGVLLSVET